MQEVVLKMHIKELKTPNEELKTPLKIIKTLNQKVKTPIEELKNGFNLFFD